ncbi:SNF2 family DNA or RNA helicase [Paenibacillus phyllosphaerae]|uniref:SNF2 family DNA or RNA helicase n=1 Tax=Paenibacillus phyllosphaerae TaxID=274593 RepID=A0A7W5FQ98_9BACL|nr:DEAD/DEAH box helicase [Paenibacillus phyllosphaerae]MBB3113231.1 SNF2 family DNA or RNA helicase [Paenibacillus phyllosphaerae]
MSKFVETMHVHLTMTAYGDALMYGTLNTYSFVPGMLLKHRLFAWHEPSLYGTGLELQQTPDLELVVLPAEQVIPFFAGPELLAHVEWQWAGQAELLKQLAPHLLTAIEERQYMPSFQAFKRGKLQWMWDEQLLPAEAGKLMRQVGEDLELREGLEAAFSASVFERYYATEEEAADLRREHPLLYAPDRVVLSGMDYKTWLVAVGWLTDVAPFRPLLQLLEPNEELEQTDWELQLVLQDKSDLAHIVPIRLGEDGQAYGSWPSNWEIAVAERSAGWLDHLRASLSPARLSGGRRDVFGGSLTAEDAWHFLTVDSNRLLASGWQVLLPAWWEAASKKKPKVVAKVKPEEGSAEAGGGVKSLFGLNSLIDFNWRIAIGDTELTEEEFEALLARNERLVQFRGQWVALDPVLLANIRQAMARVDRSKGLTFQEALQLQLVGPTVFRRAAKQDEAEEDEEEKVELEIELNDHLSQLIHQLTSQSDWPELPIPAGLQASLRSYQQDGFAWLSFLRRFGMGACLADDMGLGKTVQLITYLLHVKETTPAESDTFPSLVICPTSVLGNWQKEISRFAPSLRVMLHYGPRRLNDEAFSAAAGEADVVLTSFATSALDQELLRQYTWGAICLDEAQNIKNAGTRQSMAVRSFPAKHRIALTGTPIENRLSELWSIYDFINPGFLGTARAFQDNYATAIEKEQDEQKTADLQKLVKPFMLRRKKKDPNIQLDLPEKNEMKTYLHLTAEQSALYDQAVKDLLDRVRQLEGIERKGAILAALTQLKQLCDHPVLLTKEALSELDADGGETLDIESLIARSSKLERLVAMVRELREEGERCLIFTQYIGMGKILQAVFEHELEEPVLYLHGGTSKTARDRMIEQFQSRTLPAKEQPNVFILSIKAGGVGLNLTAANHVFHFDRWWNPAVENQATDRAYRMGQTRDVQVHKFIALGTLEERIDEMLESKQQLSDNVITSSEAWITELSTDALQDLFTLRRDWGG